MKEKMNVILGIGVVVLVIITLGFYLMANDNIEFFEIASVLIIVILVSSSSYIIWDRIKNLKAGLPAQDERLKIAGYRAGYYGFIAAIWSAVGSNLGYIMLFDEELRGGLVTAAVVLISGLVFMFSFFYFSRKG
jgi:hypothetical protein